MRAVNFRFEAFEEYQQWIKTDKKIALKIGALIEDILKNAFTGLGKPELLERNLKGYWSRRITEEHRLIYKITDESVIIFSCHSHYNDK